MEFLLEFFEGFGDMISVSDMETHELVFMNAALRNSLGCTSHEAYRGRKCYEVLQGLDAPCSFCTNERLKPGKPLTWVHTNPVMNKKLILRDGVIRSEGKRYRVEIATETDGLTSEESSVYYTRGEAILRECLETMFVAETADDALESLLSFAAGKFGGDRMYIFELTDRNTASNTYEWCAPGVEPEKALLQDILIDGMEWWYDRLRENKPIVLEDIESIRTQHPETYTILKPQNITSLLVSPILSNGTLLGYIGVDNPVIESLPSLTPFLGIIGYFAAILFKCRDSTRALTEIGYRDQLTGAYNRFAMKEYFRTAKLQSLGVAYFDITRLKEVNDSFGHDTGDQLIQQCYRMIRWEFDTERIYRVGGDEFVALFPDIDRQAFETHAEELETLIRQNEHRMAMGYVWSDRQPMDYDFLIRQADFAMYQNKRAYRGCNESPAREPLVGVVPEDSTDSEGMFRRFLATTYYDTAALFRSISQKNDSSYFYFGDVQQNMFYISDNMRDDFGFPGNVVPNLVDEWAKFICTEEGKRRYRENIEEMLQKKGTVHDLRYRVEDAHGRSMWVHCYGTLQWNLEKTHPIFFSGRITHQDETFVMDPVTSFPRVQALVERLKERNNTDGQENIRHLFICFALNDVGELNNTKGREYVDHLLKRIALELVNGLAGNMTFYRMEGMRFLAEVHREHISDGRDVLIGSIREIITSCYRSAGITVNTPCSFGLIDGSSDADFRPEYLIENAVSLIRVARQSPEQPYIVYSKESVRQIRRMANMTLALKEDVMGGMKHFRIVIQPMVSVKSGRIVAGEVLLRWTFEGKDVPPAVFIPMLEKDGLIQRAGRWVIEQAACACMRMKPYIPDFFLTFNVSLDQLTDTKLFDFIKDTLRKYRLDGSRLVVELTESSLDVYPETLNEFVRNCDGIGVHFALDDFGSGYSSLRRLLQYPNSVVKLDRSLLTEMSESADKMNFISSIVYACHRFGKYVCMEGVETSMQDQMIRETGCDMIQGFYHYRPMELCDIYRLVSSAPDSSDIN